MGLGIKTHVVQALDRRGGRTLLAKGVTTIARLRGFCDIRVFHERGRWFHSVGALIFPGRTSFSEWPHRFHDFVAQESRYMSDAQDYWMAYLRPPEGALVIDVGAGEGEDVLAFSRAVGERGRVVAIEAFPSTFDVLREFCAQNRLTNTMPIQVALGETAGTISFRESEHWVENAIDADGGGAIKVRCAPLSLICEECGIGAIDFLKMNIEGAEVQALKGMVDVFPRIDAMCISCHDFRADRGEGEHFRTRGFVVNFLSAQGYSLRFRDDPRPYVRDQVFATRAGTSA